VDRDRTKLADPSSIARTKSAELRQRLGAGPLEEKLEVLPVLRGIFQSKIPGRLPGAAHEQVLDAR
jgi:hypothetical protein